MAVSDYLAFGTDPTANVTSQAGYAVLPSRILGFQSGKAVSADFNKVWRQSSVMSAALAKAILDHVAVDVLDDGDVAGLALKIASLISTVGGGGGGTGFTVLHKVANYTANNLEEIDADTSGGAWTLTLPPTPILGYQVRAKGNFITHNLTVNGNGHNIAGSATYTMNADHIGPTFWWDTGAGQWDVRP